ncbi:hypothetical protein Scani_16170 [Streptomyces caniferus]|uniref:Uncharacterized protein n=1 Tax=Streptomyces caniferus TaxID=285557 RepID=A0A640S2J7_9ACTN|nr:hypothetical protein Scani_16170 [Streptomyces caniferus]
MRSRRGPRAPGGMRGRGGPVSRFSAPPAVGRTRGRPFQPCRRRITRKAITVSTAAPASTIPASIHASGQWCDAGW